MCDDARLRAAEERLASATSAASSGVAQEGHASLARVEVARERRDEETTEALLTVNADNVKPRVEGISGKFDRTEQSNGRQQHASGRGRRASAEVSGRIEGVLPSRKRGSLERRALEDPMWKHTDKPEMCISEITVVLESSGVASANVKMAEFFCRNRFGGAAVNAGFERGFVVNQVTGWMIDNVGQQRLRAAVHRVSPAGQETSVATRVEAAQEGPDEAMSQTLAASSPREASV